MRLLTPFARPSPTRFCSYRLAFRPFALQDCWGYTRAVNGSYQWDPERFPSGLPALVDYLAQYNMTLGVYTDSGTETCSTGGRPFKIPGSFGHYEQDAATFASWGVRAVKMGECRTRERVLRISTASATKAAAGVDTLALPVTREPCALCS
jgi:hypothetical protein